MRRFNFQRGYLSFYILPLFLVLKVTQLLPFCAFQIINQNTHSNQQIAKPCTRRVNLYSYLICLTRIACQFTRTWKGRVYIFPPLPPSFLSTTTPLFVSISLSSPLCLSYSPSVPLQIFHSPSSFSGLYSLHTLLKNL